MSRGGTPAQRARRLIESGRGIAICPRAIDVLEIGDPAVPGAQIETCAVCGEAVLVSPSTRPLLTAGWSPVCTHDAVRVKDGLRQEIVAPGAIKELELRRGLFAQSRGIDAADVGAHLPPELAWLGERMA